MSARQQPLQPTVIAVGELARRTTELVRRTIGEAIRVDVDLAPDLWPARADPAQLENAIVNLCVNARDACPTAAW